MNASLHVAKKDVLIFLRSKSALFWTIAFPAFIALFFSAIFGGHGVTMTVGVINNDTGNLSTYVIKALNSTNVLKPESYTSIDRALSDLKSHRVAAVILIPENFTKCIMSGEKARLKVLVRGGDSQVESVVRGVLSGITEEFAKRYRMMALEHMPPVIRSGNFTITKEQVAKYMELTAEPISVTYEGVVVKKTSFWANKAHWITVMIGYSFIFSGMVTCADMMVEERAKKVLKRIISSPVSVRSVLIGKLAGSLVILTISQLVLVAVIFAFLRPEVVWNPLIIPLVLAGDFTGMGIGMVVAELARDREAISGIVTAVGIMLQFFTGMYFPVDFFPSGMRTVAELIPFTAAIEAMDEMLRGVAVNITWTLIYLSAWAVIMLILSIALFPRWASQD